MRLTRLADQGTREFEQVERLAIYAAQEFPGVYQRLDRQDEVLQELAHGVKGLHTMLGNEKAALDRKDGELEGRNGSGA
jgi:aldehyde:ferredoxin oxidoreductase